MYNYLVKTNENRICLFAKFADAVAFFEEKEEDFYSAALYDGRFFDNGKSKPGFPPVLVMITESLKWDFSI